MQPNHGMQQLCMGNHIARVVGQNKNEKMRVILVTEITMKAKLDGYMVGMSSH